VRWLFDFRDGVNTQGKKKDPQGGTPMNKLMVAGALAALLMTVAVAQDQRPLPPQSVFGGWVRSISAGIAPQPHRHNPSANLFFCPSKKCLYYAGDCDSTSSNTNALFDFDNPGVGVSDTEVWVGVKPTKNATVTGTSGNYDTNTSTIGINPTPFSVRTGVSAGNGGKLVCSTNGNAVVQNYGQCFIEGATVNYYIAKACQSLSSQGEKDLLHRFDSPVQRRQHTRLPVGYRPEETSESQRLAKCLG
jgi:hypothetical protein